jgi:hypothetical protein
VTPTWGIIVSAALIGLGLLVLTVRQRGRDPAAGFDRLAGYLLLVMGVCGVFVSIATRAH